MLKKGYFLSGDIQRELNDGVCRIIAISENSQLTFNMFKVKFQYKSKEKKVVQIGTKHTQIFSLC